MEIKAGRIEGQIIGVTVSGFKVASGVEIGRVPETATKVGKKGKLRP